MGDYPPQNIMKIYRNATKIKHPDTYRKRYAGRNAISFDVKTYNLFENEVGVHYFENDDGHNISLVYCVSGISAHTDYECMSWLLILHNECYKFEYQRNLYNIKPGDVIHFNLMREHGIIKTRPGRNLFLAISLDLPYRTKINLEQVCNILAPYA